MRVKIMQMQLKKSREGITKRNAVDKDKPDDMNTPMLMTATSGVTVEKEIKEMTRKIVNEAALLNPHRTALSLSDSDTTTLEN